MASEFAVFENRRGFPENAKAYQMTIEHLFRIIGPVPARVENLELKGDVVTREARTIEEQATWIFAECLAVYDHCPTLRQIRALYQEHFSPADGLKTHDMSPE